MELTKEEIGKLAKMSNIDLTDQECLDFQDQLKQLLDYTQELASLKIGQEVEAPKLINVFREDKNKLNSVSPNLVDRSPVSKDKYFSVPKILKH